MIYVCPYCNAQYDTAVCSPCGEAHNIQVSDDAADFLLDTEMDVTDFASKQEEFEAWLKKQNQEDEEDELGICPACSGSGEGMYEGQSCRVCRGKGES
jgi:hypothetical protein